MAAITEEAGMKVRSQTFGFLTGTESFLTESLILAQNERWRRG